MTAAAQIFSPKSAGGSLFYSLAAHGLVVLSVMIALKIDLRSAEPVEDYVDMAYETFDAPPEAAPPKVIETRSEELQDQQSEVTGTQEKKEETNEGTQANNTPQPTTPYYKIKPKYPKAALISGTEGWVMLQIDVKEDGSVENVRVIDGENRNTFATEAKRAVEQWKYRPFMDRDGKPVRKADHQVRVDFNLTEAENSEEG